MSCDRRHPVGPCAVPVIYAAPKVFVAMWALRGTKPEAALDTDRIKSAIVPTNSGIPRRQELRRRPRQPPPARLLDATSCHVWCHRLRDLGRGACAVTNRRSGRNGSWLTSGQLRDGSAALIVLGAATATTPEGFCVEGSLPTLLKLIELLPAGREMAIASASGGGCWSFSRTGLKQIQPWMSRGRRGQRNCATSSV